MTSLFQNREPSFLPYCSTTCTHKKHKEHRGTANKRNGITTTVVERTFSPDLDCRCYTGISCTIIMVRNELVAFAQASLDNTKGKQ